MISLNMQAFSQQNSLQHFGIAKSFREAKKKQAWQKISKLTESHFPNQAAKINTFPIKHLWILENPHGPPIPKVLLVSNADCTFKHGTTLLMLRMKQPDQEPCLAIANHSTILMIAIYGS